VKIKILASLLGVYGIGKLSLILQFNLFAQTFLSMGLAVVIINLERPYKIMHDFSNSSEILGTGVFIASLNSLLLISIFAFGNYFGLLPVYQLFDSLYFWLILIAAILLSFASVIWESICFIVDRYDIYVKINVIIAFVDTAFITLFAFKMGYNGIFIGLFLSAILQFFIYAFFLLRNVTAKNIFKNLRVKRFWIKPLYFQGLRMQSISLLLSLAPFIARLYFSQSNGSFANGHLQVATALSSYLLPIILNGVWVHLHPFVAAHGDTHLSRNELVATLEKVIPFSAAASIFVVATSQFTLEILYTSEFLPAKSTLILYFIAEPFYAIFSIFAVYLLAIKSYRTCFMSHVLYYFILCAFVFFGNNLFGSQSYVYGHILGALIASVVMFFWGYKNSIFKFSNIKSIITKPIIVLIYTCTYLCLLKLLHVSNTTLFLLSLVTLYFLFSSNFFARFSILKTS